jgi:hypothetical protein
MKLLNAHAPPAFAADLENVPGGTAIWDEFMSACFKEAIVDLQRTLSPTHDGPGVPQFFDAKKPFYCGLEELIESPIVWNAFPRSLSLELGRQYALVHADELWEEDPALLARAVMHLGKSPDLNAPFLFRPQDEYCEWRVERDAAKGRISRVTFTCEPPEYWTALYGGRVRYGRDGKSSFKFPGNRKYATQLYRELTGQDVKVQDLGLRGGGGYNRFNRWNSTHGIVHCSHVANSIAGEVQLAAQSTPLLKRRDGTIVTNADEFICGSHVGTPGRNSDSAIAASANSLARLGAKISLANPVGVYMDHVDVSGWSLPQNVKPSDCWRVVRGCACMMQRIVIEVPPETGLTVSDISIGGEPVRYGGQLAECITVKLRGWGDVMTTVRNEPVDAIAIGYLASQDPGLLLSLEALDLRPAGMRTAFERPVSSTCAACPAPSPAPASPTPKHGGGHE